MISGVSATAFLGATAAQMSIATADKPSEQKGFSAALADVVASAAATLRQGEASAISAIQGEISPQEVVTRVMAAEQTLQTAIAIRDKLVGAYLEINRMQI